MCWGYRCPPGTVLGSAERARRGVSDQVLLFFFWLLLVYFFSCYFNFSVQSGPLAGERPGWAQPSCRQHHPGVKRGALLAGLPPTPPPRPPPFSAFYGGGGLHSPPSSTVLWQNVPPQNPLLATSPSRHRWLVLPAADRCMCGHVPTGSPPRLLPGGGLAAPGGQQVPSASPKSQGGGPWNAKTGESGAVGWPERHCSCGDAPANPRPHRPNPAAFPAFREREKLGFGLGHAEEGGSQPFPFPWAFFFLQGFKNKKEKRQKQNPPRLSTTEQLDCCI